jgi:Predicted SAM-dependent methyltransferases
MTSCGGNMRTVHTFGNGRWRKLKTSVFLRKGAHTRVEYGHPWVFAGEIERMEGTPEPGALVDVFRHSGKYVGTGTYSPHSQIRVRIVSRTPVDRLDKSFFVRRFEQCRRFRERWLPGAESYRAVYGEADFLPGLIVDKFANVGDSGSDGCPAPSRIARFTAKRIFCPASSSTNSPMSSSCRC